MELIIVVIIIGIIGNILKVAKGNNGGAQPQAGPRQLDPRELFKEIVQPQQRAEVAQRDTVEIEPEKKKDDIGAIRNYNLDRGNISKPMRVESLDEDDVASRKLTISKDQVVNGIIFSEILGPPKSRRAH